MTAAEPGSVLSMDEDTEVMKESDQKTYRSGVGKLLHMMKWSRPEISNAVRELSRFLKAAMLSFVVVLRMFQIRPLDSAIEQVVSLSLFLVLYSNPACILYSC